MAQLSILDLIERRTSVTMNIQEEIIAKVIRHKWKSLHDATNLFTSVEDSGLGKFVVRPKKITRRLEKLNVIIEACERGLEREGITDILRKRYQSSLERATQEKEYLETKI